MSITVVIADPEPAVEAGAGAVTIGMVIIIIIKEHYITANNNVKLYKALT